ncbi:MAG TPA: hypothetical protein VJR92_13105 [Gemmatimonadaceae bacterium]|nr:hypothetical protein [Gemmatimonadaceae bacterium]
MRFSALRLIVIVALAGACENATDARPANVQFRMASSTCGGPINFEFLIDGAPVDTMQLLNNQSSGIFTTSPGLHTTRMKIMNVVYFHDSTATIAPGQTFVHVVDPYCS